MKTLNKVKKENPEFIDLIQTVIDNLNCDDADEIKSTVSDVNNHGINGGFGNFIYYADTVKFYLDNKDDILKLAENMADSLGEDLLSMIQNFNCLSSGSYPNRKPDYSQNEIAKALYSDTGENDETIKNAMAWFAAEEVCRMFED